MRISTDKSGATSPSPGEEGVTEREEAQTGTGVTFIVLKRSNSAAEALN